ncbi:hypothetical protein ACIQRE_01910 [Streptomyces griseoluteus]|uniref:hypothetical protein n=1 Tax=Streptomyces griseoluteus TaxID=29306 RepID=UPI00380471FF
MPILTVTAVAVWACAFVGFITSHLRIHQFDGLLGLGYVLSGLQMVREGSVFWSLVDGAAAAWWLHAWWNGGGGDDTRRKLRQLGRRFQGVRRTAPVTS